MRSCEPLRNLVSFLQILGWCNAILNFIMTVYWSASLAAIHPGSLGEMVSARDAGIAMVVLFGLADIIFAILLVCGAARGEVSRFPALGPRLEITLLFS